MRALKEGRGDREMKDRKTSKSGPPTDMDSTASARKNASLGPDIRERIARDLRNMWDDVVQEGVPPQFVDFIDRLARHEKKHPPISDETDRPASRALDEQEDKDPR
jgi:hypothetical protein